MITLNPFINPLMEISQKNNLVYNATDGTVVVDRWNYNKIGSFQHLVLQDNDVPSFSQCGKIIPNSLRLNLTTPQNSINNTDECVIVQKIEGYRFRHFHNKPFDLMFWVKADKVGTYCVSLRNDVPDLSCIAEFTINQPNTWEEKRISFPASPINGNWNLKDGVGLRAGIVIMAGDYFKTTANTWNNGYFHKTQNQVNGVSSEAINFRITDFDIVDVGSNRHSDRDYSEEYNLCRRYFRRFSGFPYGGKFFTGIADTTNLATFDFQCEGMAKISKVEFGDIGIYDTSIVANVIGISNFISSKNMLGITFQTENGLTVSKPCKIRCASINSFLDIHTI